MVMGIGDKICNGNGLVWETTCMGMGMAITPTGISSHRWIQCYAYVIVQMTTLTENNILFLTFYANQRSKLIIFCTTIFLVYVP